MTKTLLAATIFVAFSLIYLLLDGYSADIIIGIRLPRYLLVILCGMTLASVGSVYQIMLNNPLAEPYILGISSGAALGSVIGGLVGSFVLIPVFGFVGALATMCLVWFIASYRGSLDRNRLLFTGIIVGMFIASLISFLLYISRDNTQQILNVLMGNVDRIFDVREWNYFLVAFVVSLGLIAYLWTLSNQLNLLTSGDEVAHSMGVNVRTLRRRIFIVSSLLIGICVSYAGIIGFVGLIVPQIVRMFFGADQRKVFLYSIIGGTSFLLFCDFIALHVIRLFDIWILPVGIITSFIGCPLFVYVLFFKRKIF
jgi:iron complex transport system permease protein